MVLVAAMVVVSSVYALNYAYADCPTYSYPIQENKFANNTSISVGSENCQMVKSNTLNFLKGQHMNQNAEKMMQAYIEKQQKANHELHAKYVSSINLNESMTAQLQKIPLAQSQSMQIFKDKSNYYYYQLDKQHEIFAMMKILKQQRVNISDTNKTQ